MKKMIALALFCLSQFSYAQGTFENLFTKFINSDVTDKQEVVNFIAKRPDIKCRFVLKESPYIVKDSQFKPVIKKIGDEEVGYEKVVHWNNLEVSQLVQHELSTDKEENLEVMWSYKKQNIFALMYGYKDHPTLSKFTGTTKLVSEYDLNGKTSSFFAYGISGDTLYVAEGIDYIRYTDKKSYNFSVNPVLARGLAFLQLGIAYCK